VVGVLFQAEKRKEKYILYLFPSQLRVFFSVVAFPIVELGEHHRNEEKQREGKGKDSEEEWEG
jgi:hypothetical protein